MKVRQATDSDSERIKEIAEQSFQASYSLSPIGIESIVEIEFESEPLASRLDEDGRLVLVVEEDDNLLGFAEGHVRGEESGEVKWLHVDPTERGNGVGTKLFERVLADMRERGVEVQATVLSDNQEGGDFFEKFNFESEGQTEREFDDQTVHVEVYHSEETEADEEEEYTVPEDESITVEGQTLFLDLQEPLSGEEGQMLLAFQDEAQEDHYGFYCTNCGTFTDSVDGQGKIVCENCGNEHRPEDWDDSYL